MRFMSRRTVLGALAAGTAIALAAPAQAQQPIKIGSFLAITGPASFLGDPEAKTLRLYVDQVNKAGGVLGSCTDTNDNSADFVVLAVSDQQNMASAPVP